MFVAFTACSSLLSPLIHPALPPWPSSLPLTPGAGRTTPWAGIATENAGVGLPQDAVRPRSGRAAQSNALAQDALRPGPGNATGKGKLGSWRKTQFAEGVVQENLNSGGCNERLRGEKNAVRLAATCWAADSRGELRCNGKRPVSCLINDQSVREARRNCCRFSAATPQ